MKVFLSDHKVSAKAAVSDPKTTAEQIVQAGIIEKAPIAQKALPYCNITFIEGEEMKAALSGYLNVLFEQDPKSVGGKLPADNFARKSRASLRETTFFPFLRIAKRVIFHSIAAFWQRCEK